MARFKVSSTSDLIAGTVWKGKTIRQVLKSDGERILVFTDGSREKMTKEEIIALARIKGGMNTEAISKELTPWERKVRMEKGMVLKQRAIGRDKQAWLKQRNLVGKMVKNVEGVPEIRFVRHRGLKVPVVESLFSKKMPDTKTIILRVRRDMGTEWERRLRKLLRSYSPNKAMQMLTEEYKQSKGWKY